MAACEFFALMKWPTAHWTRMVVPLVNAVFVENVATWRLNTWLEAVDFETNGTRCLRIIKMDHVQEK